MGFWSRFARTFRREEHDAEINEELQFHLDMKSHDGHSARDARVRFGNPQKLREETREAGILEWLDSVMQDLRYGVRQLLRTPALTAAIVISLTIGIAANTAIFGIADAALFKSLPVKNPGALVLIQWTAAVWPGPLMQGHSGNFNGDKDGRVHATSVSPQIYRRLAREQKALDSLIGFSDRSDAAVVAGARTAEQAQLQYVSDNFFQSLDVKPSVGRPLAPDDDRVGQEPVVVISYGFWQRQFGASPDVLNQSLRVNNVPVRIIGVAPAGFFGIQVGDSVDIYAPLAARVALGRGPLDSDAAGEDGKVWWVRQMGYAKPGVPPAASREQLTALLQQVAVPDGVKVDAKVIPTLEFSSGRRGFDPIGGEEADALQILQLLVGLVLLIVCANVANLLLARAVVRQRESAVRLALGATRPRLLRQQFVESAVLSLTGGLLGLYLGYFFAGTVFSLLRDGADLRGLDFRLDARILGYTAGISIFTALLFGLAPALRAARTDLNDTLKAHARSVLAGRLRLPRVLVALQIAMCVTVLFAAGLLGRSLTKLKSVEVGFDRANIVYASVDPGRAGYTPERAAPYVSRLREALAALPGVERVAVVAVRPLSGTGSISSLSIPGRPYSDNDQAAVNQVGDGFFEMLGIPLLAGRTFQPSDIRPKPQAAIVDDFFVEKYFPGQNAVGHRFGKGEKDDSRLEIVGVVKRGRMLNLRGESWPMFYTPLVPSDRTGRGFHFVLRSRMDSRQLAAAVRSAAATVDSGVPVYDFQTQSALIDGLLRTERLLGILSGAFSTIALALAAVGLAGLLAYAVARRRNEIGIRMALGAVPTDVAGMILRDSLALVAVGAVLGLPGAYAVGRVLKSTLYGLAPADPLTALFALAALAVIAALAAWAPARRAARIDPMAALRDE